MKRSKILVYACHTANSLSPFLVVLCALELSQLHISCRSQRTRVADQLQDNYFYCMLTQWKPQSQNSENAQNLENHGFLKPCFWPAR